MSPRASGGSRRADTPPAIGCRGCRCGRWVGRPGGLRRVIEKTCDHGLEEELTRSQPFDHAHRASTAGTRPRAPRTRDDGSSAGAGVGATARVWRHCGQRVGAAPRREDTKVADADEAFRQDVQEKPSEEFPGVERQRADLASVAIVLPPKRDRVVGHGDESVIRNCDAVRVPREIVQHVGGTAKWRLCVDHPGLSIERSEKRAKGARRGERLQGFRKVQPALSKRLTQAGHEFPAKDLPQHPDGQKEPRPRVDPPCAIGGETASGHDTVDMRMMLQALPPRVQDHQPADRGAEALRVGGDLRSSVAAAARKRKVVHDALIYEREARQHLRHRRRRHARSRPGAISASRAATHASRAAVRHLGQCRSRQLLYEKPGCAH